MLDYLEINLLYASKKITVQNKLDVTSAPTLKGRTSFGGTYPEDASATEWQL